MIPNELIHSFLHSYKRKYRKRQYVNESLKFHFSDFQFSGRGLRPRFCLRESKFKVQLELSTNLRTRYVRLFSCLYGQSNDDATIEKTIFSTNCRFIFTDVRNGYTRRLLFDMLENWKPLFHEIHYWYICPFVIWLSHHLAIFLLISLCLIFSPYQFTTP